MNFNTGNAIKYLWRNGLKDNNPKDLLKARYYVDREIKRLKLEEQCPTETLRTKISSFFTLR